MAMKRATLLDVAREAGVSRTAAARVLLGTGGEHVRVGTEARQRVEAAARRLDYAPNRPAQQLRGVSSRTMGVILDTVNAPVMSERLLALEGHANRMGYRLLVGQIHGQAETLREYIGDFAGRGVEAVLGLFDLAPGRDERARAGFGKFRKVVFHGRAAWRGGYCVRVDTGAAIRAGVDHLLARGHRRPALALAHAAGDELMELRREVFREQIKASGHEGIVWDAGDAGGAASLAATAAAGMDPAIEVLAQGIEAMVAKGGADAILASNDIWATRFILQLQKRGLRVPGDVAVIGHDNLDIARVVSPSLTTVDQCHDAYAVAALQLLLEVAEEKRLKPDDRVRTIAPRLIVREST